MSNYCAAYVLIKLPPVSASEFGFAMGGMDRTQNIGLSADKYPGFLPLVVEDATGVRRFHARTVAPTFRHIGVSPILKYECPYCSSRSCAIDRCSSCNEFPCKHPGANVDG